MALVDDVLHLLHRHAPVVPVKLESRRSRDEERGCLSVVGAAKIAAPKRLDDKIKIVAGAEIGPSESGDSGEGV